MLDPDRVTYADFIAYAESHAGKFEFVDGQIISRAKPTKRHQRLSLAVGNLLASHVQPQGCDVLLATTLALSDVRNDERAPISWSPAIGPIYLMTRFAKFAGQNW